MIAADSLECLLGQATCANVAVIPSKGHAGDALTQQEDRIGYTHADGTVTFSTNLSVPGHHPSCIFDAVRDGLQATRDKWSWCLLLLPLVAALHDYHVI